MTGTLCFAPAPRWAVAKGHYETAEAILNLDDDWIARINAFDLE